MWPKHQTVRNVVFLAAIVFAGWWAFGRQSPTALSPTTLSPTVQTRSGPRDPFQHMVPPGAEWARVLERFLRPATGRNAEDVLGGGPAVDLYDEDQDGVWERATIDTNRDGEPEEEWTLEDGVVVRRVMDSRLIWLWTGSMWERKKPAPGPVFEASTGYNLYNLDAGGPWERSGCRCERAEDGSNNEANNEAFGYCAGHPVAGLRDGLQEKEG